MRLTIRHQTTYSYEHAVPYALQQLRLRPKSRNGQRIIDWQVEIEGGKCELQFADEHANTVDLVSFTQGTRSLVVTSSGSVEVDDTGGVIGKHGGFVPLWLFQRDTALTQAGARIKRLMAGFSHAQNDVATLHALSARIRNAVPYSTDQAASDLSAEQVLAAGHGVCQDHAHVFIAAARALGFPARYVSGYLMMNDRIDQDATHAWAEAYVADLGWIGFDISNGISPDSRYVRVATGLDYSGAAPISGMRFGVGHEKLDVTLQVQQQ